MKSYNIEAVPLNHTQMDDWRDALSGGITYLHPKTNLFITGGVDDVWVNTKGEFIIVDYKATSKDGDVNLDADWQIGYKRQVEIYQWLFRRNNFNVSNTAYFVYCNGKTDAEAFDSKLEFDISVLAYQGNDNWIEQVILDLHKCLMSPTIPETGEDCDFCKYREAAQEKNRSYGTYMTYDRFIFSLKTFRLGITRCSGFGFCNGTFNFYGSAESRQIFGVS